jgi:hypothetical protein
VVVVLVEVELVRVELELVLVKKSRRKKNNWYYISLSFGAFFEIFFRHLKKKERYEWKKMWSATETKCSLYTRWFLSFFVSFILDGISFKQSS